MLGQPISRVYLTMFAMTLILVSDIYIPYFLQILHGVTPLISGYLGNSDRMAEVLVRYGRSYADQVEKDYEVFRAACRNGKLEARSDADMSADFAP